MCGTWRGTCKQVDIIYILVSIEIVIKMRLHIYRQSQYLKISLSTGKIERSDRLFETAVKRQLGHTSNLLAYLLTYLLAYLLTYLLVYLLTYSMEQRPS